MAAPEIVEGPGWLPVGEEPHPTGNITHLSVLRNDGISVLSLPSGDIDTRGEPATGMYARDTRHLSRLRFTFGGVPPILLDARQPETALSAIFTNPALRDSAGRTIPAHIFDPVDQVHETSQKDQGTHRSRPRRPGAPAQIMNADT